MGDGNHFCVRGGVTQFPRQIMSRGDDSLFFDDDRSDWNLIKLSSLPRLIQGAFHEVFMRKNVGAHAGQGSRRQVGRETKNGTG